MRAPSRRAPSRRDPARRAPAARLVLLGLGLVLTTLLPLLAVPATSTASTASAAGRAQVRKVVTGDFTRLPPRCYNDDGVVAGRCRLTSFPGRPTLVVWGDSHAQMYLPAIRPLARERRVNLIVILYGGCPPSLPFPDTRRHPPTGCDAHNVASLDYVTRLARREPRLRLLVNGFWSGYRHAYSRMQRQQREGVPAGLSAYRRKMARLGVERSPAMFDRIGRLGVPVDLVDQAAVVPLSPPPCEAGREPYQCDLPRAKVLRHESANAQWLRRQLASRLPRLGRIIDPSPDYCSATTCYAHVGAANTFYDDIHLSASLTRTMRRWFRPTVTALLRR